MTELEKLREQNRALLWHVVEQQIHLKMVIKMFEFSQTFDDDCCQWEARYNRAISGLEKEAEEIRKELE